MKYIIIADIHSNLEALKSSIKSFPSRVNSKVISVGDVVGYGASPNECVDAALSLKAEGVLGNHDGASTGRTDFSNFNSHAKEAVIWTSENLTPKSRDYLNALPLTYEEDDFTVVHGTLHDAEEFNYMITATDALKTFSVLKKKICFVGHSHIPGVFMLKEGRLYQSYESEIELEPKARYIVNAGSVGQPRDGDPRACYAVYDTDEKKIKFYRVEYDIKTAHDKIIKASLPQVLADRLWVGR